MSDAIIVALITAAVTLIGIFVSYKQNQKTIADNFSEQNAQFQHRSELADQKLDAKLDKNLAVMETKLEALASETRKHNGFAERLPAIQTKLEDMEKRIDRLEKPQEK